MNWSIQAAVIGALLTVPLGAIRARGQAAPTQESFQRIAVIPSTQPTTMPIGKWVTTSDAWLPVFDSGNGTWLTLAQAGLSVSSDKGKPVTYLGVSLEAPGEPLRAQLQIEDNVGLLVTWIDEQGPGREVLSKHDVITRLDDQIVINAEQFQALVRMHKPGDVLNVRLLRNAKTIQVNVKLGEKAVASAVAPGSLTGTVNFEPLQMNKMATAMGVASPIYIFNNDASREGLWTSTTQPTALITNPAVAADASAIKSEFLIEDARQDASSDRATIAKRLYLDVTGVAADDKQIKAFIDDRSANAYEKLVQDLMKNRPMVIQQAPRNGYWMSATNGVSTAPLRNIVMTDGTYRLVFDADGKATLTIMDKNTGATTFQGPVQKPEDLKSLPQGAGNELEAWLRRVNNWHQTFAEDPSQHDAPAQH